MVEQDWAKLLKQNGSVLISKFINDAKLAGVTDEVAQLKYALNCMAGEYDSVIMQLLLRK